MEILFLILISSLLIFTWFVIFIASQKIRTHQRKRLLAFVQREFPFVDIETLNFLLAKQKSNQLFPSILLMIFEDQNEIHIVIDNKKKNPTHLCYGYDQLKAVRSSNRIIKRGVWPKISSYEETMHLDFSDGRSFHWVLDNVSSDSAGNRGSLVVKEILMPWYKRLNKILVEGT